MAFRDHYSRREGKGSAIRQGLALLFASFTRCSPQFNRGRANDRGNMDVTSLNIPEAESVEMQQYHGNCHCGAFRFALKAPPPLKHVRACNCSICTRNGLMWIFPVPDDHLSIEKGVGSLKEYEFGRKRITHMFCPTCGTSVMGRYKDSHQEGGIGINARTLKDVELDSFEVANFNGADLDPPYKPAMSPGEVQEAEDGLEVYGGNCHCGAVTYTVTTKPLTVAEVMSCNCSLCSRNGDLWIYPKKAAVQFHGAEALTDYAFLDENSLHSFCSICGVSVVVRILGDGEGDDICPINVRTINGIQLDQLKLKKYDGKKNDPQYVLRN